jgi:hypothetical protein
MGDKFKRFSFAPKPKGDVRRESVMLCKYGDPAAVE